MKLSMIIGETILGAWVGGCAAPVILVILKLFPDFNPVLLALIAGSWGGVVVTAFTLKGGHKSA